MAPKQNGAAAQVEGPVLAVISKRLRNMKKRLRGIEEIQAKLDSGKELNPDQVGSGAHAPPLGPRPGGGAVPQGAGRRGGGPPPGMPRHGCPHQGARPPRVITPG